VNAVRRALWIAGAPARAGLLGGIRLYRLTLANITGGRCRFFPSCSHYAEDAIRARGATIGSALAVWRVLRCNPFGRGGLDPAPARRVRDVYDAGIPHPDNLRSEGRVRV
jgi:hypothetical protein